MNILFWKRSKSLVHEQDTWEIAEKPVVDYEKEHRDTMEIIEDILKNLDEIKVLVDEMKEKGK